jgi:hypothetical protein
VELRGRHTHVARLENYSIIGVAALQTA